jgi:hypothetical protein
MSSPAAVDDDRGHVVVGRRRQRDDAPALTLVGDGDHV